MSVTGPDSGWWSSDGLKDTPHYHPAKSIIPFDPLYPKQRGQGGETTVWERQQAENKIIFLL